MEIKIKGKKIMVLDSKIRSALYVISAVVTPVLAYLAESGTVSTFVAGLWLVVNSAVLTLARVNVTPDGEK